VSWTAAWIYFYEKVAANREMYGPEVVHDEDLIKSGNRLIMELRIVLIISPMKGLQG